MPFCLQVHLYHIFKNPDVFNSLSLRKLVSSILFSPPAQDLLLLNILKLSTFSIYPLKIFSIFRIINSPYFYHFWSPSYNLMTAYRMHFKTKGKYFSLPLIPKVKNETVLLASASLGSISTFSSNFLYKLCLAVVYSLLSPCQKYSFTAPRLDILILAIPTRIAEIPDKIATIFKYLWYDIA